MSILPRPSAINIENPVCERQGQETDRGIEKQNLDMKTATFNIDLGVSEGERAQMEYRCRTTCLVWKGAAFATCAHSGAKLFPSTVGGPRVLRDA